MMKEKGKSNISPIDCFYGEVEKKEKLIEENLELYEKLNQASEKLNILNEDIFDINIDTMGIIQMAEGIKVKRRSRRELMAFIGTAMGILGYYSFLGFTVGYRFIAISQIILITLMPWVIIPAALKRRGGSEA